MQPTRKKFFEKVFSFAIKYSRLKVNDHTVCTIEYLEVKQMFWYVIFGFFAAFGVLCASWTLLGLLLPVREGCRMTLQCPPQQELAALRRFCWLHEMGLLRAHLTVLDSSLSDRQKCMIVKKYPYIEFEPVC